jgi:hypothetical protein
MAAEGLKEKHHHLLTISEFDPELAEAVSMSCDIPTQLSNKYGGAAFANN